jgi:hypothetical protein
MMRRLGDAGISVAFLYLATNYQIVLGVAEGI